jgi:hypothetical protein
MRDKKFDSVKFMRQIRDKMSQEIKEMTVQEQIKYFEKKSGVRQTGKSRAVVKSLKFHLTQIPPSGFRHLSSAIFPPSAVSRPLPSALRLLSSAVCPLTSAFRHLTAVICPLPSVLCPLPSVLRPLTSDLRPPTSDFCSLLSVTVRCPLSSVCRHLPSAPSCHVEALAKSEASATAGPSAICHLFSVIRPLTSVIQQLFNLANNVPQIVHVISGLIHVKKRASFYILGVSCKVNSLFFTFQP